MKLLLIEDDENVAEVLADAFAVDGHETAIAHTGEDGLALLARERPDAVVLDVRLPTLNGVGVLRKIRSTDPNLPVIIMDRLARNRFPGNVRELENLIKRMIVLDDPFLTRIPLPDSPAEATHASAPLEPVPEPSLREIGRRASQAAEREAIAKMLEQTGWNRVRAARALRISYRALLYKIKQAGLNGERSAVRSAP